MWWDTLLDPALIESKLAPFLGEGRTFSDIQRALEALEGAYRTAGYSAVHVITPEQEISDGTVSLEVIETRVGKVIVKGNGHFDGANIRHALPALVEGTTPSARALSENIRLANENPSRKLDVILTLGEVESTVNAKVDVTDSSPLKLFMTADNSGNESTGLYRSGFGLQHNNVFNKDHAATLYYMTSPGYTQAVAQFSASYRIPFYGLGSSLDLIAAHSSTDAGTSPIVGGYSLTFSGQGDVYGLHYTHFVPRSGNFVSEYSASLDYRSYFNNCLINGQAVCGASGTDLIVHPISFSYSGTLTQPSYGANVLLSLIRNVPGGSKGGSGDFEAARGVGTKAAYTLLRGNGSLGGGFADDWQYRFAGSFQYTPDALVPYGGFGLTGANAVRGYGEREFFNDRGVVLNAELYTPDLASQLGWGNSTLRLLGFVDRARGWMVALPGEVGTQNAVGSAGVGVRFTYGKSVSVKLDCARVNGTGNVRGQFGVTMKL